MRKRGKRGQLKLSFGMIFSIFLIIIFLAVAIYAIIKVLDMQKTIQIETFKRNLQADVNQMWQSQQGSREVEYSLPSNINAVCFTSDDYENLMFKPLGIATGKNIEHINIEIMALGGEYCIDNIDGKVSLTIVKEYGESKVVIIRS